MGSIPVGQASTRLRRNIENVRQQNSRPDGGCSSVGRVPDCDSGCRGFESRQPPQFFLFRSVAPRAPWHMISLRNVTLQRGAKRLLEAVNLTLFARQKVGITGPNGSGKSSLLALLRGELHAESGDVDIEPGLTVAWVGQETPPSTVPALEHVLAGDRELIEIEAGLAEAEDAH